MIAGVVVETLPGAAERVGARLGAAPGLALAGGDGDRRLAMVWEAEDGTALEDLARQLLAADPEVVGVFPTFVGQDQDA